MKKLLFSVYKELILLRRDKAGLAILFVMPVALVFVVTLLQDAPIRNFQRAQIPIIFIDYDKGKLGKTIKDGLIKSDYFELNSKLDYEVLSEETARLAVAGGKFKVGIIIPKGTTTKMETNATNLYRSKVSISTNKTNKQIPNETTAVKIYFDPTIQKLFKTAVLSTLECNIEKVKSEILIKTFSKEILNEVTTQTSGMINVSPDQVQLSQKDTEIVTIDAQYAASKEQVLMPNSVQHNVPAWSMFAMFFIALPLAGSMIKERESGSLKRLLTMPISYSSILLGKIIIYIFVCIIQFMLMLLVGIILLPLLGTPMLSLGNSTLGLIIVVLSAAFAATGFGILVGTLTSSHEQASTFSAVSIIIAAAIGGVMVPVYLMPQFMQQVSNLSPLAWGLNSFVDIFVRGAGIVTILPNAILLTIFSIVTLVIATFIFKFKAQQI